MGVATGNIGPFAFTSSMALYISFRDKGRPETSLAKKESAPIAKWLTYAISKNRKFSELSYSEKVLTQVVNAFENGNIENPIFSNKDLDLQLTQATKEGLFSSNTHGLDAWQMFSWMQQFSDKQDIHTKLSATKCNIQEAPIYFTPSDTDHILETVLERLRTFHITPTEPQIATTRQAINALSDGQRFGLRFPAERHTEPGMKYMIDSLIGVSPILIPPQEDSFCMAFSPSINICLANLISDSPQWEGVPIFGKMSDKTVIKLHQAKKHPCNVHSTRLQTNPIEVHGVSVGPFIGFIHDQYHVFSSRFLSDENQHFLFDQLIPKLEEIATRKKPLKNRLTTTINDLSHLIFNAPSSIPRESRPFSAFKPFIENILEIYSDNESIHPIGTYEDQYYVALTCWLKQHAPNIHLAPDPDRPAHVVAVLEWVTACGNSQSASFSETEFQEGQRLVSKLGDCLPYDGFDFRQDDAPGDVYRRFIA